MKYIKKFNENVGSHDLDFETFKLIIDDLVDHFDIDIIFHNYEETTDDPMYDAQISIQVIDTDIYPDDISFGFEYLLRGILPDFESTEEMNPDTISLTIEEINRNISKLEQVRLSIDRVVQLQKKFAELFTAITEKTIPRLKGFSNCDSVDIGMDLETLRICFSIKKDDDDDETY
jgi:hypothetical protein